MPHNRRWITMFGGAALLAVAACGTSTSSGAGGGGSNGATCKGTVTVASDLPTSGSDASIGGGTEHGVELAVKQANDKNLLNGCKINYIKKDDSSVAKGKHDPQQGATNVTELANNPAVVGVVGPFNSSVAQTEIPITNSKGLAQISPSNTDPGLTLVGTDPDIDTTSLKPSGKLTYFRVISNDTVQAKVMAQVAYSEQKLRNIYDIDDQETYGKDLSNYFDADFKALGGTIVKRTGLPGDTKDFRQVLTEAKGLGADGIFFGGVAANGSGIIKAQMADVGLPTNVLFLSGDGTVDPQYFKDAGAAGEGGVASSAPDTLALNDNSKKFVTDFKAAYSIDPVAYSTYGYDSMNILLDAVKNVLSSNNWTIPGDPQDFRTKVIEALKSTDWQGTIGETKFDANGDTLNHSFSVYKAQGGKWVSYETIAPSENGGSSGATPSPS